MLEQITVIAGPCAIESEEQLRKIALHVVKEGANVLRGGAFKPRTRADAFQGLGLAGLQYLQQMGQELHVPVVSELMDIRDLDQFIERVDIIQIGSRNMYHTPLLKELGRTQKPVLLKRGLSATLEEFYHAAEYIAREGNQNIILCERGIRTFETYTRNTFDINAIPSLKNLTPYPVIADSSHGTGRRELVGPIALAALVAGADGIMVEVHHDPERALSDGEQSLTLAGFSALMGRIRALAPYLQKKEGSSV